MLRNIFLICLACIAAPFAVAQALVPLPAQPDGVAWPSAGWESGALPAEHASEIQELLDIAMVGGRGDLGGETHAVVIVHKGRLVAEVYRDGFDAGTRHMSWSLAKSVTSALVGRAVQPGLVDDIDAPMPGVFSEGDPRAVITWRQWITMTDGLEYHEFESDILEANDVAQMMYGAGQFDVIGYIRDSFPLKYAPGTRWNYSTASFSLVGRALQNVIGANSWCSTASAEDSCKPADAPMAAWIDQVLFNPLGMDAQPEFDLSGTYLGGSHVWATARDYAKFGLLYLRDGVWDGERLLPEGWVDMTRTPPPGGPVDFYGAGFWLLPGEGDAFYAQGHEGQTIFIVPSRDLIVVRLALMEENDANWEADLQWNLALAHAFP
jgi:CubicO group peptidase (beta-lactamase class C family)